MLIEDLVKQLDNGKLEQPVQYSADSVFLQKIHDLEKTYKMMWFEFMQKYDERSLDPRNDQERLDYAEWHMLCQKFEDKLEDNLEGLTIWASPPPEVIETLATGGPSNRASSL